MKITGIDALQKKLRENVTLKDVKYIVKSNTSSMNSKMQKLAPVDTGNMKRSITSELTLGGLTGKSGPHTNYASYVEYGTRFQNAQPFVKPAFNIQKKVFTKDLERLMK
ncbi:HK97-gp10 family putative phage morphogenesis protein [Lactococcus petauri]|uniref:HK97-gp10 family putative phage morphogenesis protein n=1 Tax=Lactococcus petauri TaxID=1940789 RepID=UPI0022E7005E|nr:HK97-gp10 family putative phage morphogenesis protein [Lactococcus petauri]